MVRPSYIVGVVLTIVWIILGYLYIESQVGWDNLFFLLPTEVAVFFAAGAVPLGLLWLVIALLRVADRNRINQETVETLARRMADSSPDAQQRALALVDAVEAQNDRMAEIADRAEADRETIAKLTAENAERLETAGQKAAADAEAIRRAYAEFAADSARLAEQTAARIREAMDTSITAKLTDEMQVAVVNLEKQSSTLSAAAKTFGARLDEAEGLLDAHRVHLAEATARATSQAGEMRSAFSAQAQELSQAAEVAAGKMTEVRDTLSAHLNELDSVTGLLQERVDKLEASLGRQVEVLTEASSRAAERAEALETAIDKQRGALAAASDKAESDLQAMSERIKADLDKAVDDQKTATVRAAEAVRSDLLTITEEIQRLVATAFSGQLDQLGDKADAAGVKIKATAEDLRTTVETALGEQVTRAEETTARIKADIDTINAAVTASTADLSGRIEAASKDANAASDLFRKQVEELAEASEVAADRTEAVKEAVLQGRREAFLLHSATIVKELNELAVDLDRVFEPDLPDNVNKLYQEGDIGIFVRRIVRTRGAHSIPLVKERIRRDSRFRRSVETYMKRFENLLAMTTACDPDKVLTSAFLTADVGKVYLLLARATRDAN